MQLCRDVRGVVIRNVKRQRLDLLLLLAPPSLCAIANERTAPI